MRDTISNILTAPKLILAVAATLISLADVPRRILQQFGIGARWARIGSVFVIIGILLVVPSSLSDECIRRSDYKWGCLIFAIIGAILLLAAVVIHHLYSYSYTQYSPKDRLPQTHIGIGGRVLTTEAENLKKAGLNRDEILEKLEYNPDRIWERGLFYDMHLPYNLLSTGCAICLMIAIICGVSWLVLNAYAGDKRVDFHIITPNQRTQIDVKSSLEIELDSTVSECDPPPRWEVTGVRGESEPADLIGQQISRSKTGIYYKPPWPIKNEITAKVTVFSGVTSEFQSVLIHLQTTEYGTRYPDRVSVPGAADMRLEALILNADYSFRLGACTLKNADIGTAIRNWSRDGLFEDFDIVVSVGAASREHLHTTDEDERRRSRVRAAIVAAALKSQLSGTNKTIWGLNVGRFQSDDPERDTELERQVVIIGIKGSYSREQVLEGLKKAVQENKKNYDIFARYKQWYRPLERWDLVDPELPSADEMSKLCHRSSEDQRRTDR